MSLSTGTMLLYESYLKYYGYGYKARITENVSINSNNIEIMAASLIGYTDGSMGNSIKPMSKLIRAVERKFK